MQRYPRISVVVPTFNERENLPKLAARIFEAIDPSDAELLIVDDNSPDGTAAVARELAERWPVRCIVRSEERGLATAVIRGLREARGDLIVSMDADLSHPPEKIAELIAALEDPDVEMAIGSRFVAGGTVDLHWPLHRRLNSLFGRWLALPLTRVRDMMSGFFAVRRADLNLSALHPIGYKIALELIVRHEWTNIVEVPIRFTDRAAGQTKLNVAEQLRYLRHLGRLYTFVLRSAGWTPLLASALTYALIVLFVVVNRAESSSDFRDYWRTALHFRETGQLTSEAGVHNYLPFFPIFMAAWSVFPLQVAIALFTLLSFALLALTYLMTEKLIWGKLEDAPRPAGLLALLLVLPYLHSNLVLGTVGPLVLFLIVSAVYLAQRVRGEWVAGLTLGLAALIKIIPGALLGYFLLRGRWRVALAALAAIVVFGLGLPMLMLGFDTALREHAGFRERAALGHSAHATIFAEQPRKAIFSNNSTPVVLRRLLTNTNARPGGPDLYVSIASWPQARVWLLYVQFAIVAALVSILATLVLTRFGRADAAEQSSWVGLGIWSCLLLVLSPLLWTHYLILAWPALVALAARVDRTRRAGPTCRLATVGLIVWGIFALCLAWPAARAAGAQLAGVLTLWFVLVLIALNRREVDARVE